MARSKHFPAVVAPGAGKSIPDVIPGVVRRADGCPSWRFSEICIDGNWGWGHDPSAHILEFLAWSKSYESMTWPEIFKGGSAGKSISKELLPKESRNELIRTRHDDIDFIVELRPAGKPRAWGVRHGSALLLIFWDPRHTFYPVKNQRRPTGN